MFSYDTAAGRRWGGITPLTASAPARRSRDIVIIVAYEITT